MRTLAKTPFHTNLTHWLIGAIGYDPRQGTLQITPSRHLKVVPVGNIGEFSLALRPPGAGRSLQTRRMPDDDPGGVGRLHPLIFLRRPELILCPKVGATIKKIRM